MPFLSDRRTLAAGAVVANILDGKFNRVLQENSKVTVAQTSDGDVFGTIIVGRELLMDDQEIPNTAAATPRNPEDILAQTVGRAGEEVILKVRNADAVNPQIVVTHVYIEPL